MRSSPFARSLLPFKSRNTARFKGDQDSREHLKMPGVVIDPISGEELQALAEKIFATPAAMVERAKQAMEYKAP
jgi:hypothetical protein